MRLSYFLQWDYGKTLFPSLASSIFSYKYRSSTFVDRKFSLLNEISSVNNRNLSFYFGIYCNWKKRNQRVLISQQVSNSRNIINGNCISSNSKARRKSVVLNIFIKKHKK